MTIAESLGLPVEDYEQLMEWSDASLRVPVRTEDEAEVTLEEQEVATRAMGEYFSHFIESASVKRGMT